VRGGAFGLKKNDAVGLKRNWVEKKKEAVVSRLPFKAVEP
jgi:hypothetical protein